MGADAGEAYGRPMRSPTHSSSRYSALWAKAGGGRGLALSVLVAVTFVIAALGALAWLPAASWCD